MEFNGEMQKVVGSSNISGYGYDKDNCILRIAYAGGMEYDYLQVPLKKWELLRAASSKGSYVSRHIVTAYEAIRISDGAVRKISGPVQANLKSIRCTDDRVLYSLWMASGKPIPGSGTSKEKLYAATKAILIEAAGSNQVRTKHLPDAIRLAAERGM